MPRVNHADATRGLNDGDPKPTVPAVERAVAALRHLQAHADVRARTVTRIAEALGIHKSSCSNLMWTLTRSGLVEFDPAARAFQLGPELISLGASAARDRTFASAAAGPMEALARETGMTCVAYEQIASEEFIIVGKVESSREIKVTIDVGQHFHPATPGLARVAAAYMPAPAREAYLARWAGRTFTPATQLAPEAVAREVERVRERGYAISRGEYYAGNTAIIAPVFSGADVTCRGLCLVAFNEDAARTDLESVGRAARAAADAVTRALGGERPSG